MTSIKSGNFVTNIVHFGRVLRASGLSIGTGQILDAVSAVNVAGIGSREDFYWTLHAVFVKHPRQRVMFDQAFHVFWRNPRILEKAMSILLPEIRVPEQTDSEKELSRRLVEALYSDQSLPEDIVEQGEEVEFRANLTYSDREQFRQVDFESMSIDEQEEAKKAIAKLRVAFRKQPTRRYRVHHRGDRFDMRKTLQQSLRDTGDSITLVRKQKVLKPSPIIVLCDISGSMAEYSRMMLHFAHVLVAGRTDVAVFVFGTRLTNITRHLNVRDVDVALDDVSQAVVDWHGGTMIGGSLKEFNKSWVRRLETHKSIVLLVTDGLDRSEAENLEQHVGVLHRSCKKLIWLNPLLRYEFFEAKVSAIRTMLRHVDDFRPVHNLDSLSKLADVLSKDETALTEPRAWLKDAA